VLVSDFDYQLPENLIAQEPLSDRAASRMLRVDRHSGELTDLSFRDLPRLLHPGDLLVFNNTRVFPARIYGRRSGARAQQLSPQNPAMKDFLHGRVETLLVKQIAGVETNDWTALVRPGRKIGVGEHLYFGDSGELEAEVIGRAEFGERTLRFNRKADFFDVIERIGHVPLPPYIGRDDRPGDRERYQTVYARERGSVAAPTAGLHFTPEILAQLGTRGIETAELTLHVGLGTFQPVHEERVEDHRLHREWYQITQAAAANISRAIREHQRVIAVGTTSVRTLEHAARNTVDGTIQPSSGETGLFIYPGFQFKVVSAMLTNFHLPKSTLLMLVSAFGSKEHILSAYRHAVEQHYRFYSYGDCMFVE
jgi:S-adenosylmethionine:tRNA ribosyltransferase-isomerase